PAALSYLDESLVLARRIGNRPYEWAVLAERTYAQFMLGRWDEALAGMADFGDEQIQSGGVLLSILQGGVAIHVERGDVQSALRVLALFSHLEQSTDFQERSCLLATRATLHRTEGRLQEALAEGEATIETAATLGIGFQSVKQAIVESV